MEIHWIFLLFLHLKVDLRLLITNVVIYCLFIINFEELLYPKTSILTCVFKENTFGVFLVQKKIMIN